jgi:mRNA-degrading endonuclease RelE of RelBE toxin-antitoxin system
MEILFSDEFKKDFSKIKDQSLRLRIIKQMKKIAAYPQTGKPLRFDLKGHRTLRVPPFRIVYRLEKERIIINCFDHRKDIYDLVCV